MEIFRGKNGAAIEIKYSKLPLYNKNKAGK